MYGHIEQRPFPKLDDSNIMQEMFSLVGGSNDMCGHVVGECNLNFQTWFSGQTHVVTLAAQSQDLGSILCCILAASEF